MFKFLVHLTDAQLDTAADALERNDGAAALVDPSGVFVVFTPCPNYEVDFACAREKGDGWEPVGLTALQYSVLQVWASRNVPALCKRWQERHPKVAESS